MTSKRLRLVGGLCFAAAAIVLIAGYRSGPGLVVAVGAAAIALFLVWSAFAGDRP